MRGKKKKKTHNRSLCDTQSGLTLSRVTNGAQREGGDPVNWGTLTISSVSPEDQRVQIGEDKYEPTVTF